MGCHPATVVTALTAQDTRDVRRVLPQNPDDFLAQARLVLADMPVAVIKVGLLGSAAMVEAVGQVLAEAPAAPGPLKVVFYTDVHARTEWGTPDALAHGKAALTATWGALDFEGADHVFDVTAYYAPEMGTPLFRRIVSFAALMPPTLYSRSMMPGARASSSQARTR